MWIRRSAVSHESVLRIWPSHVRAAFEGDRESAGLARAMRHAIPFLTAAGKAGPEPISRRKQQAAGLF
jgi:hypothetical protein